MSIPIHVQRLSALSLIVGIYTTGLGTPAKEAEPPKSMQDKQQARTDLYGDPLPTAAIARLGTIRLRPGNDLFLVACLPDGKTFLSLSAQEERTMLCQWRVATGELLHRIEIPMRVLGSATLSRDGKTLVMSGYIRPDATVRVRLWDIASGKLTGELAGLGIVQSLEFAPDGKTIAVGCVDQTLRLWDRNSGKEIHRFKGGQERWGQVVFSPDGKILASSSTKRRKAHLWDAATGQELRVLEDDPGEMAELAFSADGKILATVAAGNKLGDKTIRLWDAATGKIVREIQGQSGTSALTFSPDGKYLASGDMMNRGESRPIHLWDVNTGRELRHLSGHGSGVKALAFSADSKLLISGGGDNVLRIWDFAAGKELLPLTEHQGYVSSVAFSPDGCSVASSGVDGTIRLWRTAKSAPGILLGDKNQKPVWNVSFTPDGRTLISHGADDCFRFWDVAARREIRHPGISDGGESSLACSPDGRTLARWPRDGVIQLLDAATGVERRHLIGSESRFGTLLFSPDGKRLASMNYPPVDPSVVLQLWDVDTGKELYKWNVAYVADLIFSPDGRTLFGIDTFFHEKPNRRTFHVWDILNGEDHAFVATLPSRPNCAAISPDGRMLAWGDVAGAVTLWELAANQVRRGCKGHHAGVVSLAFSPDGKTLASGSADTTVLLWDVLGDPAARRSGPPSTERLQALWDDLASKDAGKAFNAIGQLTASPEQAISMLKSKLRPAPAPAVQQRMAPLIADLDNDEFAVRDKAMEQLRQLGERAEPGLREALTNKPSLEARKRIEELLEGIRALSTSPERLREMRAIEVLEHVGTADAREVLRTLAKGAAHARLTHEAKAALERLAQRCKPRK
ncbi:MAG: WD40 repeat domain-containing protein [Gemmataceae bacterium]